jgi:hypothetical protein
MMVVRQLLTGECLELLALHWHATKLYDLTVE